VELIPGEHAVTAGETKRRQGRLGMPTRTRKFDDTVHHTFEAGNGYHLVGHVIGESDFLTSDATGIVFSVNPNGFRNHLNQLDP
jgi:hypothetical protein